MNSSTTGTNRLKNSVAGSRMMCRNSLRATDAARWIENDESGTCDRDFRSVVFCSLIRRSIVPGQSSLIMLTRRLTPQTQPFRLHFCNDSRKTRAFRHQGVLSCPESEKENLSLI